MGQARDAQITALLKSRVSSTMESLSDLAAREASSPSSMMARVVSAQSKEDELTSRDTRIKALERTLAEVKSWSLDTVSKLHENVESRDTRIVELEEQLAGVQTKGEPRADT